MAFDMAKFLARFVEEAREHVERLNKGLVFLEKNPNDHETLNAIFRSAHTIKGSSRMMKLTHITEVAHKTEDVLGALREGKISYSKELADLIFKAIDVISDMIDKTASGLEITDDNSTLCEELAKAAEGSLPPKSAAPKRPAETETHKLEELTAPDTSRQPVQQSPDKETKQRQAETIRINAEKLDEIIRLMGEIVSSQNRMKQRLTEIKEIERIAKRNMELAQETGYGDLSNRGNGKNLVLAQSLYPKIKHLAASIRDDYNLYELLSGELQEKALMMRMVPLSVIFDSMHRMVRDISKSMGKEIDFVVEGGGIELDRKMIDKLGDPLIHMIRNSIDHGIEDSEERLKAGKPERGSIRLSACYDAGSVLIELSDDGRGISVEKIKEKALRKKMFTEEELDNMSRAALIDLIFQPGLSTSAIITDISGRGVGMDVVKRNIIDELRGSISIDTAPGKGTSFYVRLPLSLAIVRILLISTAGMPFAISSNYVSEVIRLPESEFMNVVDKKAIRLRDEFIPVVNLDTLLKLPLNTQPRHADKGLGRLIMVVHIGAQKLGLIIDDLLDEEDMVIKSLPEHMKNISLVSGVIISGMNEIISVLHIPAVIEAAKYVQEARHLAVKEDKQSRGANILVVDDSINTREIEKSILEAYGYTVTLAEDGMDGLNKAMEFKYDVVITDIEMPRLDGFSLTERLRQDERYKDTPIIIVTSREKEEDKQRGIRVGADAYIVKGSFDQTNLLDTVQNLIG
jgi:chemotaxis protein histidine kinase CheA